MQRLEERPDIAAERRPIGVFAFLMGLLGAAYPLAVTASFAHAMFSGCWLACGGAVNPSAGIVWVVVCALLLGTPFAIGMYVARVRSWSAWAAVAFLILLAATSWLLFSLDPDTAEFYVSLGSWQGDMGGVRQSSV